MLAVGIGNALPTRSQGDGRTGKDSALMRLRRVALNPTALYQSQTPKGAAPDMRAETERTIDEIKQALALLRRHL